MRIGAFSATVLVLALCLPVGRADAQEVMLWPVVTPLAHNDADVAEVWHEVGSVSFWNTHDQLIVRVTPSGGLGIEEVAIHIVSDPAEIAAVLDRKGRPKISAFTYKTDYTADRGAVAESHQESIDLRTLDVCWSVKPEICPPNRYILVAVELQGVSETAFAKGGNAIVRSADAATAWAHYVTYPLAKVEPGHFIDANVNGLTFWTPTQSGTTGENGQFWFVPAERIGFSVGSLYLGEAQADRSLSPVDLFPGGDLDDDTVLNVARLLQSLDADGNQEHGAINITEAAVACLERALATFTFPTTPPETFFADDLAVGTLIDETISGCDVPLVEVSKDLARERLADGQNAGNLMKRNISKTPDLKSDKAQIEIMPVYVPAQRSDGTPTAVTYYDADGNVIETRNVAKPILVSYVDEVEGTNGAMDVFVAISRDDGETWKRRNISRTADKSSLAGHPGASEKPMLRVMDNKIFLAWTDKYCRGGRPGYAITVCPDTDGDGVADPCEVCRDTADGTVCSTDYPGDDAYWQDDIFGVGGPQRSVTYPEYPEKGEVPYSCVWTARGVVDPATGAVQWFKPERVTSGRRDAFQLTAQGADDVAFVIIWQEDPKGLVPGEGDGPGEGWSGANTHNKSDIWFSYVPYSDFDLVDTSYPEGGFGDELVDRDPELVGRVKALVPMSLPVKISDNDICSLENMLALGGGEHQDDEEGEGTHRYCGDPAAIGTADAPGPNPLCAYTHDVYNPKGELHHVCVTADGRLLDGDTGASRPNVFLQPYKKSDGSKGAWVIIGYEESKGVGIPPADGEEDSPCGGEEGVVDHEEEGRYKPDIGKNVIYHSFDLFKPETVSGGGILNLPERDADGNLVYLVDEAGELLLDWKGEPQLDYENARRPRFLVQPKSKAGPSGTVLVALWRQGQEGSGKPADIFMRRLVAGASGNPYAFKNFVVGAQNLSSVDPTLLYQDPFDPDAPVKMLRWSWTPANLADTSAKNPYTDSRAHRGALVGDDLIIAYTWTPNWGRRGNDKYDLYVRRSFNGGRDWTTDPRDADSIEHNVVFRVPVEDPETRTVTWDEEVVTTVYAPGAPEPPRNVSNLRRNRTSVLEPRLIKTPGTILTDGAALYPEDVQNTSVYQVAYGLELNQNALPDGVVYPRVPLDIYYSRTLDRGQRYQSVLVTPQDGSGKPEEGWNPLAKDQPDQGAPQIRQTPDGSRLYGIWLEESEQGSDIIFRRVDYR